MCPKGSTVKRFAKPCEERIWVTSVSGRNTWLFANAKILQTEVDMKRFLNLALAAGLVLGTASSAQASSLTSLYNRYVAPTLGTPYVGNYNNYGYYGYNNYGYSGYPYTSNYVNPYYNPYYGYNSSYYSNPYYGYNYGYTRSGSTLRNLGNALLNWF
jgi:hypothetical protein